MVVLEDNEQAGLRRKRRIIINKRKVEICDKLIAGKRIPGFTLKGLAREEGVQPSQIRRWLKDINKLRISCEGRGKYCASLHTGRPNMFQHIDALLDRIRELREAAMPVSVNMVVIMASKLDPEF